MASTPDTTDNEHTTDSERFKNRSQALRWLKAQGYKVSQGKFYMDCKEGGFPGMHRDGSVSRFQVLQYGQQLDLSTRSVDLDVSREHDARKSRADADMAEMKAEKMRRDEDKAWLHASQAWGIMAALVGTLRDCIRHHLYIAQGEIVLQAGGEQDRSQEVYELTYEIIDRAFNEIAGESINVVFEKEGK